MLGTCAIALIVSALFYVPWRIESSGDLQWAPFYRNPAVGRSTLNGESIETRFIELQGRPIWPLYVFQLVAIGGVGVAAYWYMRDENDDAEDEAEPLA